MAQSVKLSGSFSSIKQRDQITVDGYVKEMEKSLFSDDDDQIIPSVIIDLCIEYYTDKNDPESFTDPAIYFTLKPLSIDLSS